MMYKILLVTPELEYTGALQSYRRMCKVLNDNGYKVSAVSYKSGPFAVELKKIGIDLKIIDIPMLKEKEIIRYIKQFDLVLANTIETYKVADIAQLYIPTIWYIREADNLPEFFGKDPARKEAFERARNRNILLIISMKMSEFCITVLKMMCIVAQNGWIRKIISSSSWRWGLLKNEKGMISFFMHLCSFRKN